ncbi:MULTISPECIES: TIGR03826 family flagellar region protein [Virgibacillus]|uniref:Flagellar operon protein n=1 Tax=Virgibacillus massiliensis TaxID=1462526 RepID=A0A024Q911_9BACI|nr:MULTISPECIES: TIGR03826 family flagellar region protein [Virgibacillus]EQB37484.1 hypothetical protein M948_02765 [Virgibacillus sp. CM-4]MYL40236.1 hypothetical protein [Virgibacillus massiliensis]CDQ38998.1 flagellar operon protein [Virgibacillus massiliensis]
MSELANCTRCDRLFVKGIRNVCFNCYKEEEASFQTVSSFLRKQQNRQATLEEIVDETGVEEQLIIKFIKEGRLHPASFPNLTYPCTHCKKPISSGNVCKQCSEALRRDLESFEEQEKRTNQSMEKRKTYYMFDS